MRTTCEVAGDRSNHQHSGNISTLNVKRVFCSRFFCSQSYIPTSYKQTEVVDQNNSLNKSERSESAVGAEQDENIESPKDDQDSDVEPEQKLEDDDDSSSDSGAASDNEHSASHDSEERTSKKEKPEVSDYFCIESSAKLLIHLSLDTDGWNSNSSSLSVSTEKCRITT